MDRWVSRFTTRDQMAEAYALVMRTEPPASGVFAVLNLAIIDRWSKSGLEYIKRRAWNIADRGYA